MVYGVFDRNNLIGVHIFPEEARASMQRHILSLFRSLSTQDEVIRYNERSADFSIRVAATKNSSNWYEVDDPDLEAKILADMQPKKRGRPALSQAQRKVTVHFTAPKETALLLHYEALKAGVSVSEYCYSLIESHPDRVRG